MSAWQEGFEENQSAELMTVLAGRLQQFNALFVTAKRGDVILLDHQPDKGMRVTIKGEAVGTIPGKDFNDALLQVWLGDEPADGSLKDAMVGDD